MRKAGGPLGWHSLAALLVLLPLQGGTVLPT